MKLKSSWSEFLDSNNLGGLKNLINNSVSEIDSYNELTDKEKFLISESEFNNLFGSEYPIKSKIVRQCQLTQLDNMEYEYTDYRLLLEDIFSSYHYDIVVTYTEGIYIISRFLIDRDEYRLSQVIQLVNNYLMIKHYDNDLIEYHYFESDEKAKEFWNNEILPKCNKVIKETPPEG